MWRRAVLLTLALAVWGVAAVPALAAVPPSARYAPYIWGNTQVGQTLTTDGGSWEGSPLLYAYQWQRCNWAGAACRDVASATGSTYEIAPEDADGTLRVVVVATNDAGSTQATSAATSTIYPGPPVLAQDPTYTYPPLPPYGPSIVGVPMEGSVLTALPGTWTGAKPITVAYQWQSCDSFGQACWPIWDDTGRARDRTYTPDYNDVGKTIAVEVRATNAYGTTTAMSSPPLTIGGSFPLFVLPSVSYPPYNWGQPSISGDPTVGQTLTAEPGYWYDQQGFAYQWQRCDGWNTSCKEIPGAIEERYTLTAADAPALIRVRVTGFGLGGLGQASSSPAYVYGDLTATVAPQIIGKAQEGETLTVTSGAWSGAESLRYDYRWQRCADAASCVDIPGATRSSHEVGPDDAGLSLRAVVVADNSVGYGEAASDLTAPIPGGAPRMTSPPTVEGSPRAGATLTAGPGTWTGEPTGYEYQWQRCDAGSSGSCTNISSASSSSYSVDHADVGSSLRVVVTATNDEGRGKVASAMTEAVRTANDVPPEISGEALDGATLSVSRGSWSGDPIAYRYQWERCRTEWGYLTCSVVTGANTAEYTLTPSDVGRQMRASVIAVYGSSSDEARTSLTAAVRAAPPKEIAPPVLRGQPVQGRSLTVSDGQWSGTPAIRLGYQWQRCTGSGEGCVDLDGATENSRRLASADVGRTFRVVVSAANDGGSATSQTQLSAPVQPAPRADQVPAVAGLDPLESATEEQVPSVQQPDPKNRPVFDTTAGLFAGAFANPRSSGQDQFSHPLSPTIALGAGHIYVATNSASAPYGPGVYSYSDGSGCNPGDGQPRGVLCRAVQLGAWHPSGIAFYRDEVIVPVFDRNKTALADSANEVRVYDRNLNYRRTLATATANIVGGPYNGIDVASGEMWAHQLELIPAWTGGGWFQDRVAWVDWLDIRDVQTGALRGVVPVNLLTSPTPAMPDPGFVVPFDYPDLRQKDVAISPELDVVAAGAYAVHRSSAIGAASLDAAPLLDPAGLDGLTSDSYYNGGYQDVPSGEQVCANGGPPWEFGDGTLGLAAPWGMRWQIRIDNCFTGNYQGNLYYDSDIWEFSVDVDPDTGAVKRKAERVWGPKDSSTNTSRDIAYKPTNPTLNWWGKPTQTVWQRGTQSLGYVVSVGDYYIAGNKLEHWWQPASQQSASLKVDGATIWSAGAGTATGTPQINEDAIPSGVHSLTLTVMLTDGTILTKTNDAYRIDHDAPTGTLDPVPAATNGTITGSGAASDAHSGPKIWALEYRQTKDAAGNAVTDSWHTACTPSAPSPETGKWSCGWDTTPRPEGTYQLQPTLTDNVNPADGGPNTGTGTPSGNATVIVDRTPPALSRFAPALGQYGHEAVTTIDTPVRWTQSDATSGIADAVVSYNAGSGHCDGAWREIGRSTATDVAVAWDTADAPSGLTCLRSEATDRAGNTATPRWQTILSDRRFSPPPRPADPPPAAPQTTSAPTRPRYYAGIRSGVRVTIAGIPHWLAIGQGVTLPIITHRPQHAELGADGDPRLYHFSANRIGGGHSGAPGSIEVGTITEAWCARRSHYDGETRQWVDDAGWLEGWWIYASYIGPHGYRIACPRPGSLPEGTQYRVRYNFWPYFGSPDTGDRPGDHTAGALYWRPAGEANDRVIEAHDVNTQAGYTFHYVKNFTRDSNGNYISGFNGGAASEVTHPSRPMDGTYHQLSLNANPNSWPANLSPIGASTLDTNQTDSEGNRYGYYSSWAWPVRGFCTAGPNAEETNPCQP
jgi:hypothetical protein